MSHNFAELLNVHASEIKRPEPIAPADYQAVISKIDFGESSKKKTPQAEVFYQITGVLDAVDPDAASRCVGKTISEAYYLTPDARFRLFDMLTKHAGIQTERLDEAVQQAVNQAVGIKVTQRIDPEDPEKIYNDVKKTFKL